MKITVVNHKNLSRARNGAVPASDNTMPKDETPIAELLKEAFAEFDQEDIEKQIQEIRERNQTKKKSLGLIEYAAAASFVGLCCSLMLFEPGSEGRAFTQIFKRDVQSISYSIQSYSLRQCFPLFEYRDCLSYSNGTYQNIYQEEYSPSETDQEKMSSKNPNNKILKKNREQKAIKPFPVLETQGHSSVVSLSPPTIVQPEVIELKCADYVDLNSDRMYDFTSHWVSLGLNANYDEYDKSLIDSYKEIYSEESAFCRAFTIHDIRKKRAKHESEVILALLNQSDMESIQSNDAALSIYMATLQSLCHRVNIRKPSCREMVPPVLYCFETNKNNNWAWQAVNQRGLYESNCLSGKTPWVLIAERSNPWINTSSDWNTAPDSQKVQRLNEYWGRRLTKYSLFGLHINQLETVISNK